MKLYARLAVSTFRMNEGWGVTRKLLVTAAFASSSLLPSSLHAQVCPEFQVNTFTTAYQGGNAVAAASNGNFVVVWNSLGQDGSGTGVFGQRYASSGSALGTEFQVNTYTTNFQTASAVATAPNGDFVVVWGSDGQDGSLYGVFGQRYASSGSALGTEFQINTTTTGWGSSPAVATAASGDFVVVWENNVGTFGDVFGQRYASNGSALGTEFQVNTYTTSRQGVFPVVAAAANGDFVVVWASYLQDGSSSGVFGQRYASGGSALGTEFQVNTYTTSFQTLPAIAATANGDFVVVWDSGGQDAPGRGIFGQRYASSGSTIGTEFQVNTYTTGNQSVPAVAVDASGDFVVIWSSDGQDGSNDGVFGQRYASSGSALGTEFLVNSYTCSFQEGKTHAVAAVNGDFVVTWSSDGQDGSSTGIFGQMLGALPCPLLPCFAPGNGNHYLCRQVKDLKVPAKFVSVAGITVSDQTGNDVCEAKKPFLLCDPVDKNGGGILDPSLHYCCYKAKCGLKPAVNYEITDQFWNGTIITTKKPKFLCNPCQKAPAP